MIGDAILFGRGSGNRRNVNLSMLGKVGIDFLINGFQLFREDGHEDSLAHMFNEGFFSSSLSMILIVDDSSWCQLDLMSISWA